VRPYVRLAVVALIACALAAGAFLARRGRERDRRDLDALVTVGGDLAHDAFHPALDLTRLSDHEEAALGREIDACVRGGLTVGTDSATQIYLDAVLRRVAAGVERPGIPYTVALVRSSQVNAWAVAGGRLYLTDGMLRFLRSEAELAAVLGHEISHVDLRHCVERLQMERAARRIDPGLAALARLGYEIMLRGFSEEQELQADGNGALLAARAVYDPWQAIEMYRRLPGGAGAVRRPTRDPVIEVAAAIPEALQRYLETHPPVEERLEAVRRALAGHAADWRGARRYVGRSNLAARQTLEAAPRDEEWITRDAAPP